MTGFAALDYAHGATVGKPAQGGPHGFLAKAGALGEPGDGEAEVQLAFEAAVPHQVRVDGAIGEAQVQTRDHNVRKLFPHKFSIGFFSFHVFHPGKRGDSHQ